MASVLDDPEFWLPNQFLSDDSVTEYYNKSTGVESSDSNSGFTSPVDSSMGSTETESEEDEFLTELTRRLASFTHFSQDVCKPNNVLTCDKTNTSWKLATSTQLTLNTAVGWDSPAKPCTISVSSDTKIDEYHSIQYHHHYVQCNKQQKQPRTKQQKAFVHNTIKQCQQNGVMRSSKLNGRPLGLSSSSAWPTLHQSHKQQLPAGSWTTPVFSVSNRGCSGTGVFLPRPVLSTKTTCQKPGAFLKPRSDMAVLAQAQQRQDKAWSPVAMSDEVRLPQEWTY